MASVSERLVSEELVELLVAMLRFVILLFVFDSVSSACKLSLLVRPWNGSEVLQSACLTLRHFILSMHVH